MVDLNLPIESQLLSYLSSPKLRKALNLGRVTMLQSTSACYSFQTRFEFWRTTGPRPRLHQLALASRQCADEGEPGPLADDSMHSEG
jgi:hypothetical protein